MSSSRTPGARTVPLADLVAHVAAAHHDPTRIELRRALDLATRTDREHAHERPEVARLLRVVEKLRDELLLHMTSEERVLFPYIVALEAEGPRPYGTIRAPIARMLVDHDDAGIELEELRVLTNEYTLPTHASPTEEALYACLRALDRDIRVHLHIENELIFPRALALEDVARAR